MSCVNRTKLEHFVICTMLGWYVSAYPVDLVYIDVDGSCQNRSHTEILKPYVCREALNYL